MKYNDQKQLEAVYKQLNEDISGVYPQMSMAKEFGSAVFFGAMLFLPAILEKLRVMIPKERIKAIATEVAAAVKNDQSEDSLKEKVIRAANSIIQKFLPKKTSVESELNTIVPDNLESKTEEQISHEINRKILGIKNARRFSNFRG